MLRYGLALAHTHTHTHAHKFCLICLSVSLQPFVGPRSVLQFLNRIHSRQDSFDGGSCIGRYLHMTTQTQNKGTQTSMP
jgi:hypothetical protein